MSAVSKDTGVISVLAKRMVEERLPKALALKERVDKGAVLNELDLAFLEQVVADAGTIRPLMQKEPRVLEVAGRKIWKLSPMDLLSYSRWYDYSKARDEMLKATDTAWAPWYVVNSNDKKKARLNLITHLLGRIPYKKVKRDKVKLPKRGKAHVYKEPDYPFKFVPEKF